MVNSKTKYDIARKRVKKRSDFRSHLVSYVVTISFLFVINILTSPGYLWVIWPALGWGVGIAFHAFTVMGLIADEDKEEELIEQEIRRMERKELEQNYEEDHLELKEIKKEPRYNDDDFV